MNNKKEVELSVRELNRIKTSAISEYKKSYEFDNIKKTWEARGRMKFADEMFQSLTDEQQENIIDVEVGERNREDWTIREWWKGMTITERKNALINLNLKK